MASFVFNHAAKEMWDGTVVLLSDTIKAMLVDNLFVANRDNDFVDAGGANDAIDHEISTTNYAAGHGGSGRKTLASKTIVEDDVNDRAEFSAANLTWSAIGPGSGGPTVAAVVIIKAGASDDTTAKLIAYVDSGGFPKTVNGGDLTVTWNAEGIIQLSTV